MRVRRAGWSLAIAALLASAGTARGESPSARPAPTRVLRERALARELLGVARLWAPPPTPIEAADLRHGDPGHAFDGHGKTRPLPTGSAWSCRFVPLPWPGRTPKFLCQLDDGETVKVKYGNREVHAEIAAARLLRALGFGADRMLGVEELRCRGCPEDPETVTRCLREESDASRRACMDRLGIVESSRSPTGYALRDDSATRVFRRVAVERRPDPAPLPPEASEARRRLPKRFPWKWGEMRTMRSTIAEQDALLLLLVFLQDWDSVPANNTLLCARYEVDGPGEPTCTDARAFVADLGASFGRKVPDRFAGVKFRREAWARAPLWEDAQACLVSFPALGTGQRKIRIREAGRAFLASRLAKLREAQVRDLFRGAFAEDAESPPGGEAAIEAWVATFRKRVAAIQSARCRP